MPKKRKQKIDKSVVLIGKLVLEKSRSIFIQITKLKKSTKLQIMARISKKVDF